jgi:HK97 family phage major capsid protein
MSDESTTEAAPEPEHVVFVDEADVTVRSVSKREIEVRLLPWNTTIETVQGPEEFARGAMAGTPKDGVMLMGLEHEASMGIGQDGRPVLTRRVVGRSTDVWEADDGPRAIFKVGRTQAGDELLALADDRIVRGVSAEFRMVDGGTSIVKRGGRRVNVHTRVQLTGASLTYRPAYGEQAVVLAVRSQDEGEPTMPEAPVQTPETPAPVQFDTTQLEAALGVLAERFGQSVDNLQARMEQIEERSRADILIPSKVEAPNVRAKRGDWMQAVLAMLSGERVNDLQMRALDDLVTTDNVGVVPDAFVPDIIGVIDPTRPFLNSTRKLDLPAAGMSLVVPKIVTRPETGVQAAEKDDIASNTTSITTESFDAVTIAGGGDISLQLLKRSSPSFLSLYLELLAESYARNAEIRALTALYTGDTPGGTLDPENANFGQAWKHGAAVGQQVDTLWLSSTGVAAFIDAKADGTNAPLYSSIQAGFTAGSGAAGTISGLRPVYVPAMDSVGDIDAIVGPSRGFGWTEDGTYTLQVDVPAKAGRDVAIVGILWFAPMYPSAFTTYQIAS